MYQLEDRILFDGAAIVDVAAAAAAAAEQQNQAQSEQAPEQAAQQEHDAAVSPSHDGENSGADALTDLSGEAADVLAALAGDPDRGTHVLVVSDQLWNTDGLLDGVKDGTIVIHFEPGKDTGAELLQKIADALNGKEADSIGFLTGASEDGGFELIADGKTTLSSLDEAGQRAFWSGLDGLLTDSGKVDIFASDLAGSEAGRELVDALGELTHSEVNASDDLSGDIDAGGDWDLEYSSVEKGTGADRNAVADYFDSIALDGYDHALSNTKSIAFINPTLMDPDTIIAGLGDDVEVVFLPRENAFEFMTDYLSERSDIDAIHIFTHGEEGKFLLGWTEGVDSDFIHDHSEEFAAWGKALSADGDILIYGCDVAGGETGAAFVDLLSEVTGCDVAASSDRVGLGGDWVMEYTVGKLEVRGYVFNDYFYSLKQLTVKNNADDGVITSPSAINENDLSLREALYIAEDGDMIVFANQQTLAGNARTSGEYYVIMLEDTLVIDKNVTIDGSITTSGSPAYQRQVVIDGSEAQAVVLKAGSQVLEDFVVDNGVRLSDVYKFLKIGDSQYDWSQLHYLNEDGTWAEDVVLSTAVALQEALKLNRDLTLGGTGTFKEGTDFGGALQLDVGDDGMLILNFNWQMLFDLQVGDSARLEGGSDVYQFQSGTKLVTVTGTQMTTDTVLSSGTVLKAGSYITGTLNGQDFQTYLDSDMTIEAGTFVVTGTTILADGSSLAKNSVIKGSATDFVTLGRGSQLGNGAVIQANRVLGAGESFQVARGFTIAKNATIGTGSELPEGTLLFEKGEACTSNYIYAGTYIYQSGDKITAGTELLGDVTMGLRAITINAVADVVEGVLVSSDTTTSTTQTTPVVTPNTDNLEAGTTVSEPQVTTKTMTTTTTDDFGNTLVTTTTVTTTTVTTTIITASTETEPGTITTYSDIETVTEKVVTKNELVGVELKNLQVTGGHAAVRPRVAGGQIGTVTGEGLGGGILISGESRVTLTEVLVAGNRADKDGGGIYNSGSLLFTTKTTSGNFLKWENGIIANIAGSYTLTSQGGLDQIIGVGNGGGIYNAGVFQFIGDSVDRDGSPGSMVRCYGNVATGAGGGIYSSTGQLEFHQSSIGANGRTQFFIGDISYEIYAGNQALSGSGGGVFIDAKGLQPDTIYFYRTDVAGNIAAENGGGIYFTNGNISGKDALSFEWCDFTGNVAMLRGGALYITGTTGSVSIQTVIEEAGVTKGVNIQSSLSGNFAGVGGGAIAVVNNKGNVTIDFVQILNNHAGEFGGGLYVENSQNVYLTDVEISNNEAGGALDSDGRWVAGTVSGKGGGIYFTNQNPGYVLSIERSGINSNVVNSAAGEFGMGGGIYLDRGTLKIESSTLAFNGSFDGSSYALGGAIYMHAGTLTINFSSLAYNRGKGAAIYIAGDTVQKSTLNVSNSIIYNGGAADQSMVSNNQFNQIFLADAGGTNKFIDVNFSTSNNLYSHYYKDAAVWERSIRSDGRTNNALTLSATQTNGSGWVNGHKLIAATEQESTAIQKNVYLDTELGYHANYRTQSLAIISEASWVYNVVAASGVKYDQRGNLRVDPKAWVWDSAKNKWVQGTKTKASIGAFEPIFYLEVSSKGDDSKIKYTSDANGHYLDAAYGGSGLTLREATYWVDSRSGLLKLANNALESYLTTGDTDYFQMVNQLLENYNRYYTGVDLYLVTSSSGTPLGYRFVTGGEVLDNAVLVSSLVSGIKATIQAVSGTVQDAVSQAAQNIYTVNAGAADNPASFGYLMDYQGNLLRDAKGNPLRISTTGTIGFDADVFAAGQDNTINLTEGQIYVARGWFSNGNSKDLVIGDMYGLSYRAQDADDRIVIKGNGSERVFTFGSSHAVVLNNLTITGGKAAQDVYYAAENDMENGGGIWNNGILTLNNVRLTENSAANALTNSSKVNSGYGGGLFNGYQGMAYLYDCTIDHNTVTANASQNYVPRNLAGAGGGLFNAGYMVVERSNISYNTAVWGSTYEGAQGVAGGGIYNTTGAVLKIANSTIAENIANSTALASIGKGGAIYNAGSDTGVGVVVNSKSGGVLYSYNNTIFNNQTILKGADNQAPGYDMAALYSAQGSSLYMANTLVAGNSGKIASSKPRVGLRDVYVGSDVVRMATSFDATHNVIGAFNGALAGGFDWDDSSLYNVTGEITTDSDGNLDYSQTNFGRISDLRLEVTMDYNGGKTMTYRVLGGSSALEGGILTTEYLDSLSALGFRSFATDQRGVSRLTDGNGNVTDTTNIGAFETISLLVVGSGKDSLDHRTGFDFANNLPLWESPDLTLREALYLADDGTTVVFKSGWAINGSKRADGSTVSGELNSQGQLIIMLQGELSIVRNITINGNFLPESDAPVPGMVNLKMASNANSRIFYIKSTEDRLLDVNLYNLSLSGGRANNGGLAAFNSGGAIYSVANLTLENVEISDSQAGSGGFGGGIYSERGMLSLTDVVVTGCVAQLGGGIYAKGYDNGGLVLNATNVSIIGNIARTNSGQGGSGGGVYVESGNSNFQYTTIGNNKSGGHGGGIYQKTGSLTMYNSTVANNTATNAGGGVYFDSIDQVKLDFVTVANNQSSWTLSGSAASGQVWNGGGIYMVSGNLLANNSLIAQNFVGALSLSSGIHDDVFLYNDTSSLGNSANNLFGKLSRTGGREILPGGSTDANGNYYLNAAANGGDWARFSGTMAGYSQLLDTKLAFNGGKQMTVYVYDGAGLSTFLQRAQSAGELDQTQLEMFDGQNETDVRKTVGAFEKQERHLYFVQGDLKGNALTQSQWVSSNGMYLLESDGVLNAADTRFIFIGDGSSVNITHGDRVINQLVTRSVVSSTGEVIYYTTYFGAGKDAYTATDFQRPTSEMTGYGQTFQAVSAEFTEKGTLVADWTLGPTWLSEASRSSIVVKDGGWFTVAANVVLAGRVVVMDGGNLELATTNYSKLGVLLDGTETRVVYSAEKAQTVINTDYLGNAIDYDHLALSGGAKTFSGNLALKSLEIGRNVTLKINAVSNGPRGDLLVHERIFGDGTAEDSGKVTAAGSILLGSVGDATVSVGNVILEAGKTSAIEFLAQNVELTGYATVGNGTGQVFLDENLQNLTVSGMGNVFRLKSLPYFREAGTQPGAAPALALVVKNGGELSFDFGRNNITLSDNAFSQITVEDGAKLKFVTGGKLSCMLNQTISNAGTVALYGTITVNQDLLQNFDGALEFGGTVTLTSSLNWAHDLTLNGTIKLTSAVGSSLALHSDGDLVIGGTIDMVTGRYVSGNGTFSGSSKDLDLTAGGMVYLGGLKSFRNVTVDSLGNAEISLGGSVSVSGNLMLLDQARVLEVYDAKGRLMNIALTASGMIQASGFVSDATGTFGELQLSASNKSGVISDLGAVDIAGTLNFLKGNFQVASIDAGALSSKATLVNVAGDVTLDYNVAYDNNGSISSDAGTGALTDLGNGTFTVLSSGAFNLLSGKMVVGGTLNMKGGVFTNSGTFEAQAVTLSSGGTLYGEYLLNGLSYENEQGETVNVQFAEGILNGLMSNTALIGKAELVNKGTLTVSGTLTAEDADLRYTDATLGDVQVLNVSSLISNRKTLTAGQVMLLDWSQLEHLSGTMTVTGGMVVQFGTITNKATMTVSGNIEQNSQGEAVLPGTGATLINRSKLTVDGTIDFSGLANSRISNEAGTLTVRGIDVDGTLYNKGTIKVDAVTVNGGMLENRGTMKEGFDTKNFVNAIELTGGASILNYGTLSATSIEADSNSFGSISNMGGKLSAENIVLYGELYNKAVLYLGTSLTLHDGYQSVGGQMERITVGSLKNYGTISGIKRVKDTSDPAHTIESYTSYGTIEITGSGNLENNKGKSLTAGDITLVDGNLLNYGTLTVSPVYRIVTDTATKAKSVEAVSGGQLEIQGKGTLNNNGTMKAGSIVMDGAAATGDIINNGSMTISSTMVTISGGLWKLSEGTIALNGNFTNNAGKTVRATGLEINGVFDSTSGAPNYVSGGELVNSGTMNITAASKLVTSGSVQKVAIGGDGSVSVYGSMANLKGSFTAGSLTLLTGDLNNEATLALNGLAVVNRVEGGQNATLVSNGELLIEEGSLYNAKGKSIRVGSVTMNGAGTLLPDGSRTGSIVNNGTITAKGTGVTFNKVGGGKDFLTTGSGQITLAEGSFTNTGSVSATEVTMSGAADLTNSGTLTVKAVYTTIRDAANSQVLVVWGNADGGIHLGGGNLLNTKTISAGGLELADVDGAGAESGNVTNHKSLSLTALGVKINGVMTVISDGNLSLTGRDSGGAPIAGNGELINGSINSANKGVSGTIRLKGIVVDVPTGMLAVDGNVENLAGSLTAVGATVGGDWINGWNTGSTVKATLTITPVSGVADTGRLEVGGSLTNRAGTMTVNSNSKVAESGQVTVGEQLVNYGTLTAGGSLSAETITNSGIVTVRGTSVNVAGQSGAQSTADFQNEGTFNATSAQVTIGNSAVSDASLTNKIGKMSVKELQVYGEFRNEGTFSASGLAKMLGGVINTAGSSFTATNADITGSVSNYGKMTVKNTLTLHGANIFNNGTVSISKDFRMDSSVLTNTGTVTAKTIYSTYATEQQFLADQCRGTAKPKYTSFVGNTPSPAAGLFAALADRAAAFNARFDGEAGQALEEFLAC